MGSYLSKKEKRVPTGSVQRKTAGPKQSPDRDTVQLSRMLRENGIQAKLKIGKPNDRYEQEADRVAARVMAAPDSGTLATPVAGSITPLAVQRAEEEEVQAKPLLQRQEEEEEEEELAQPQRLQRQEEEEEEAQPKLQRQPLEEGEEMVQAKRDSPVAAPAQLSAQLQGLRGSGQPLPASERAFFEPRFGADFSAVRVHSGGQAAQAARSVQAKAFTAGQDLIFNAGQYAPGSNRGRKLLAHELTHVIQQRGGHSENVQPDEPKVVRTAQGWSSERRFPEKLSRP
jgi:hypothetical protein